jgi:hypothetical protein
MSGSGGKRTFEAFIPKAVQLVISGINRAL